MSAEIIISQISLMTNRLVSKWEEIAVQKCQTYVWAYLETLSS